MRKRVCVLEDDEGIRDVIEMILSEYYDVDIYSDVKSFHERNVDNKPDIYLLDVMLPDGNGIDVCNELRVLQTNSDVPIIIMSAAAKSNQVTGKCSPNKFIKKPFDIDHLVNSVGSALA